MSTSFELITSDQSRLLKEVRNFSMLCLEKFRSGSVLDLLFWHLDGNSMLYNRHALHPNWIKGSGSLMALFPPIVEYIRLVHALRCVDRFNNTKKHLYEPCMYSRMEWLKNLGFWWAEIVAPKIKGVNVQSTRVKGFYVTFLLCTVVCLFWNLK